MLRLHLVAWAGENDGSLNGVPEFAYVARPIVGDQQAESLGRQARWHRAREPGEKMLRKRCNVFATFAQGRNGDNKGRQAEIEVAAVIATATHLCEVAVGG